MTTKSLRRYKLSPFFYRFIKQKKLFPSYYLVYPNGEDEYSKFIRLYQDSRTVQSVDLPVTRRRRRAWPSFLEGSLSIRRSVDPFRLWSTDPSSCLCRPAPRDRQLFRSPPKTWACLLSTWNPRFQMKNDLTFIQTFLDMVIYHALLWSWVLFALHPQCQPSHLQAYPVGFQQIVIQMVNDLHSGYSNQQPLYLGSNS